MREPIATTAGFVFSIQSFHNTVEVTNIFHLCHFMMIFVITEHPHIIHDVCQQLCRCIRIHLSTKCCHLGGNTCKGTLVLTNEGHSFCFRWYDIPIQCINQELCRSENIVHRIVCWHMINREMTAQESQFMIRQIRIESSKNI